MIPDFLGENIRWWWVKMKILSSLWLLPRPEGPENGECIAAEDWLKNAIWVRPVTMTDKRLYFHLHGLLAFIWQI